jgi:hypothetical protein
MATSELACHLVRAADFAGILYQYGPMRYITAPSFSWRVTVAFMRHDQTAFERYRSP